jgi:DHA3 family tetracycline resistance protein-like MFS transporter
MILFAAFKRRRYTYLWFGQLASHLGTHIYELALAWWVLQKTGSAAAMGGVLIAAYVPTSILVLAGGVLADRLSRVPIMLVADCVRFALMIVMALLAFNGSLTIWLVLVLSALVGVMDAFFWPAYKSIFPELVPQSELASANSLEVIGSGAVHILAPAIGAGLVAASGIPLAFGLNGVSFLLSAVSLIVMLVVPAQAVPAQPAPAVASVAAASVAVAPLVETAPELDPAPHAQLSRRGDFWRELREGLQAARALPWVWLTIVLSGLASLAFQGSLSVALPYYVQHTLAASPWLYGGLLIAAAVGGVPVALWFGSRRMRRRGLLLYTGFTLSMLAMAVVGWIPIPSVMLAAMFIQGLTMTVLDLAWATGLQQYIPLEKLGRVSSIDQLSANIALPISYGLTGIIVDRIGAAPDLIWSGLIAAAIVSLGFLSRSVRALD